MKKTFIATAFVASIIASPSFAKTQGSYLGVDFLSVKTSFYQKDSIEGRNGWTVAKPTQRGSTFGAGVHYNYAFNFNNFFIAPGVIFEQDSFGVTTEGNNLDRLKVKSRYGAKVDIGYDIFDSFAPYATVGYGAINYKSRSNAYQGSNIVTADKSASASSAFFGGGLKFALSKSLALNLEYNYQKFTTNNAIPAGADLVYHKHTNVSRIDVVKVGLSYNF